MEKWLQDEFAKELSAKSRTGNKMSDAVEIDTENAEKLNSLCSYLTSTFHNALQSSTCCLKINANPQHSDNAYVYLGLSGDLLNTSSKAVDFLSILDYTDSIRFSDEFGETVGVCFTVNNVWHRK